MNKYTNKTYADAVDVFRLDYLRLFKDQRRVRWFGWEAGSDS